MAIIQEKDRAEIQKRFAELRQPVKLINFTQEHECQYCHETRQLLEELVALSDKLSLEVFDFVADKKTADGYGVDKIPATVVVGEKDYGIRIYGIPAGYEFATLLDDILMVSRRDSGLSAGSRQRLAAVEESIHLQVFVTPT